METEEDEQEEEETPVPPAKAYNDYDLLSLQELPDELTPISTLIEMV